MTSRVLVPAAAAQLLAQLLDDDGLDEAACRGQHPMWDAELPGEDDEARAGRLSLAARVCRHCPVRATCADVARERPAHRRDGVWAGQLYQHRDRLAPRTRRRPDTAA